MSTRIRPAAHASKVSTASAAPRTSPTSRPSAAGAEPAIEGRLLQTIYGPRGDCEGILIEQDGQPLQLVFDRHDSEAGRQFANLAPGRRLRIEARPQGPSPKGPAAHPVYAFGRLLAVDGRKPAQPKAQPARVAAAYRGTVVRLNYARHGAPNGVVLDTGDFIHLKPEGMARLRLKVGDEVRADGDAHRLGNASGWVVEATQVNGKALSAG